MKKKKINKRRMAKVKIKTEVSPNKLTKMFSQMMTGPSNDMMERNNLK